MFLYLSAPLLAMVSSSSHTPGRPSPSSSWNESGWVWHRFINQGWFKFEDSPFSLQPSSEVLFPAKRIWSQSSLQAIMALLGRGGGPKSAPYPISRTAPNFRSVWPSHSRSCVLSGEWGSHRGCLLLWPCATAGGGGTAGHKRAKAGRQGLLVNTAFHWKPQPLTH